MNTKLLEAFRIIMQTGTVAGAADALGRSPSAMSRMLDRLEEELQIKLFDRRKGRVLPTPEAHALIADVERAFISLNDLGTRAKQVREGHESNLTIAVLPALGIRFVPRVMGRFSRQNPEIGVTSHVLTSQSVEQWVARHQVELGLAETPFRRSGFETSAFIDEPYVLAVHAEHRLAQLDLVKIGDLRDEKLIQWTNIVAARRLLDELFQHAGVSVKSTIETSMSSAMIAMVGENLGVALIDPISAVLIRDPQVVIRRFDANVPCRIARMMPKQNYQREVVNMFLACAEEERDALLARRDW